MIGLLVRTPSVCCPQCKMELLKILSTNDRVVFQHPDGDAVSGCSKINRLFSMKPVLIEAEEI